MSPDDDEAVFRQALRDEIDHYRRAAAAAEALGESLRQGGDYDALLAEMLGHLDAAAVVERRNREARERWRLAGLAPGQELAGLLDVVGELLSRMSAALGEAERAAAAQQRGLAPRLDALISGERMRRAYGEVRDARPD